jgi:uncharacterized membrane protein YfcA
MFIIFPALVFTGVPSIIANASSTFAVIPGVLASAWAYRADFQTSDDFPFVSMVIVSVVGGIAGALLLLFTPQKTFDVVIPWLLLFATLLFIFGLRIETRVSHWAGHCGRYSILYRYIWRLFRRGDRDHDAGDVDCVRSDEHS